MAWRFKNVKVGDEFILKCEIITGYLNNEIFYLKSKVIEVTSNNFTLINEWQKKTVSKASGDGNVYEIGKKADDTEKVLSKLNNINKITEIANKKVVLGYHSDFQTVKKAVENYILELQTKIKEL